MKIENNMNNYNNNNCNRIKKKFLTKKINK